MERPKQLQVLAVKAGPCTDPLCSTRPENDVWFPCLSDKRVFDLMKDFGTSKSTKIDSIFDSLLVPR
ncbi:MAG: hypothetical protein ABW095_09695, partial [Candidatus Thiodiazotropha sp.]